MKKMISKMLSKIKGIFKHEKPMWELLSNKYESEDHVLAVGFYNNKDCIGLFGFGEGIKTDLNTCFSCDKGRECLSKSKDQIRDILPDVCDKTDKILDLDMKLNGCITNDSLRNLVEMSLLIEGKDIYDYFRQVNRKLGQDLLNNKVHSSNLIELVKKGK